ncbi:unnamed protein product [Rotaria sp. Silwood2]|nr:unnamed protein product [Rotaria sp. Silwood2]
MVHVATNLITSILLGNDWINSNHVHLFGDQNQLTIPDQHDQLNFIPYVEPTCINYPALLVHQITIPPYSQALVDITCPINNANDFIFEPYERTYRTVGRRSTSYYGDEEVSARPKQASKTFGSITHW